MALNLNYEPLVLVEDITELSEHEWLQWRTKGIGGSDVAAILGISPWKTQRDLYRDKVGDTPAISDANNNWVAKEVGHRLEELVAQIYQKKTGYRVYAIRKIFQHPLYPFLIADVDFFVEKPDGRRGTLECKTSHYLNKDKWANNAIPRHYECQGRHYISVCNLDFAAFACLFGNNEADFEMREVERDLDIEKETIAEISGFWSNHVLARVEPPYRESSDLVLESIRRYYGAADKRLAPYSLPDSFFTDLKEIEQLKDEKSILGKQAAAIEEQIRLLYAPIVDELGQSCQGICQSGDEKYKVTYNPLYRSSISKDDMDRLRRDYPEIYDEFVTTTESRVFRVKKLEE